MEYKFEKLQVWELALNACEQVSDIISYLPDSERFNLSSQINRATTSIALNIAEGSTTQTNAQQLNFIGYAIRSLIEVIACLRIIKRRNYQIPQDLLISFEGLLDKLFIKFQSLSNYLKRSS